MPLPQLVGMSCIICQRSIDSIVDGVFCDECGNPIHKKCLGQAVPISDHTCERCGGDAENRIARLVRAALRAEAQFRATGVYPLSKGCPACGCEEYSLQDSLTPMTWDRVCTECGMRYSPPISIWRGFAFVVVGLVLLVVAAVAMGSGIGVLGAIVVGIMGLTAILIGGRSLASRM